MNFNKDKSMTLNIISMIIFFITWIYDFFFRGGGSTFRLILVAVTIWIFYFVYKKSFMRKVELIYYLVFIFIVASIYLGNVFNFYEKVILYDKILHSISGLIIAFIGYVFFLYLNNGKEEGTFKKITPIIFSILFSIAAAGVWEIWEFTTDRLLGFASQNNSLIDTMGDIICGTVTGILANIPMYFHVKGKKIKFIDKIIEEMKR